MSEESKTLEAYLAPYSAQAAEAPRRTRPIRIVASSQLQRECDTMTAVSDIITGEDLNWHSKTALKKYVPNLADEDTYNASQHADDHPLREHRSSLRW
jgi:putative transposase